MLRAAFLLAVLAACHRDQSFADGMRALCDTPRHGTTAQGLDWARDHVTNRQVIDLVGATAALDEGERNAALAPALRRAGIVAADCAIVQDPGPREPPPASPPPPSVATFPRAKLTTTAGAPAASKLPASDEARWTPANGWVRIERRGDDAFELVGARTGHSLEGRYNHLVRYGDELVLREELHGTERERRAQPLGPLPGDSAWVRDRARAEALETAALRVIGFARGPQGLVVALVPRWPNDGKTPEPTPHTVIVHDADAGATREELEVDSSAVGVLDDGTIVLVTENRGDAGSGTETLLAQRPRLTEWRQLRTLPLVGMLTTRGAWACVRRYPRSDERSGVYCVDPADGRDIEVVDAGADVALFDIVPAPWRLVFSADEHVEELPL